MHWPKKENNPCGRVVKPDKYEGNDPANELWWRRTFEEIEFKYRTPIAERLELIKQVLPPNMVRKLMNIYDCDDLGREPMIELQEPFVDPLKIQPSDETTCSHVKHPREHSTPFDNDSQYTHPSQDTVTINMSTGRNKRMTKDTKALGVEEMMAMFRSIEEETEKCGNVTSKNPYRNFFKRPPERAATWRPLPQRTLQQLNLLEEAEAIKEIIARNFVEWLNSIGGNDQHTITVDAIKKMFQVGIRSHAATSLCVRIKEMPCVSDEIAQAKYVKTHSRRNMLYRQLHRDIAICAKTEEKMYAFGKLLPRDIRISVPSDNIARKWLHGVNVPKELEDMSAVWKGITNLRSTRGFCNWLLNHPNIPKPVYLEQTGLLDESMRNKRLSLDSRKLND